MPKVVRTNFIVKHPDKSRSSFSILVQETTDEGKRQYKNLEDPRVDALNKEWHNSKQTETEKERILVLMKEIRKELNDIQRKREGRDRIVKHEDNQRILEDFFEERINHRKDIVSHKPQIQDFTRAVTFLGNLSLKTAKILEIQKQVNKIEKPTLHRRVCSRVNSLLGFIGRRERLRGTEHIVEPFILSESEFLNLYPNLEGTENCSEFTRHIQNLFITLYYTGMRVGEAFALQESRLPIRSLGRKLNYFEGTKIGINSQMLIDGTYYATKTRRIRTGYLYPNNLMDRIEEWVSLDLEEKKKIRDINYTHILQKALRKTFGNKYGEYKRMKPHDCRHSYAVNMLSKGVNISMISKILGNGVSVCEKYYIGYVVTDELLDVVDSIVNTNSKPKLRAVK